MMHISAVVAEFADLPETELIAWIDRGWISPGPAFADIDLARIRMIHDMRTLMRIEDETIPLVLSLLDQIYDLRGRLRSVLRAIEAQPAPVREQIVAAMD